jgi:hypothetical protein
MQTVLFGLALCATCLAAPTLDVEVVVPAVAAHPQNWLDPQLRNNPDPDSRGKQAGSLAEFVAPEVISRIVVDQYAGPVDDCPPLSHCLAHLCGQILRSVAATLQAAPRDHRRCARLD